MQSVKHRTDADIQQAVLRELRWDSRVEETEVGVEVDDGIVTLTGTVSSYGKKLAAAEAAHRVDGVLDVVDEVEVRVPGAARTDLDVARAVRSALEWNVLVPHDDIQSTVTDGWVSLTGVVNTYWQREDAAHAVRDLAGVRGVTNEIQVAISPAVIADHLEEAIEEAMERRAQRAAKHIEVHVRDGTVTVSGKVHSWEERQAILGTVGHAPGVREVRDELTYESPRLAHGPGPQPTGWRNH